MKTLLAVLVLSISCLAQQCSKNPSATLGPDQTAVAGTPLTFTLTLTDNDDLGCQSVTYDLAAFMPEGWQGVLANSALTVTPQSSSSTTFVVTSATTADKGSYDIHINAQTTARGISAATTYVVQSGTRCLGCGP